MLLRSCLVSALLASPSLAFADDCARFPVPDPPVHAVPADLLGANWRWYRDDGPGEWPLVPAAVPTSLPAGPAATVLPVAFSLFGLPVDVDPSLDDLDFPASFTVDGPVLRVVRQLRAAADRPLRLLHHPSPGRVSATAVLAYRLEVPSPDAAALVLGVLRGAGASPSGVARTSDARVSVHFDALPAVLRVVEHRLASLRSAPGRVPDAAVAELSFHPGIAWGAVDASHLASTHAAVLAPSGAWGLVFPPRAADAALPALTSASAGRRLLVVPRGARLETTAGACGVAPGASPWQVRYEGLVPDGRLSLRLGAHPQRQVALRAAPGDTVLVSDPASDSAVLARVRWRTALPEMP